jgi:ubiquitin-like-conjugating enzyme ATG10
VTGSVHPAVMPQRISRIEYTPHQSRDLRLESMLSVFPHLDDAEFDKACSDLLCTFHQVHDAQNEWLSVEKVYQNGTTCLGITTYLQSHARVPVDNCHELEHDQVHEDDDEVGLPLPSDGPLADLYQEVLLQPQLPRPTIHYDVVLSPIYRTPILYISIVDSLHRFPPTMTTLYEHLVPRQFKAQTENVGIIGGITIAVCTTNKPIKLVLISNRIIPSPTDPSSSSTPVRQPRSCKRVLDTETSQPKSICLRGWEHWGNTLACMCLCPW